MWIKSSFCDNSGSCVEVQFIKSSFCNADGCVEVGHTDGNVLLRDSKLGDRSPVLVFPGDEWDQLLADWREGRQLSSIDGSLSCVRMLNGHLVFMHPTATGVLETLHFDEVESAAFGAGVLAGEFDRPIPSLV